MKFVVLGGTKGVKLKVHVLESPTVSISEIAVHEVITAAVVVINTDPDAPGILVPPSAKYTWILEFPAYRAPFETKLTMKLSNWVTAPTMFVNCILLSSPTLHTVVLGFPFMLSLQLETVLIMYSL